MVVAQPLHLLLLLIALAALSTIQAQGDGNATDDGATDDGGTDDFSGGGSGGGGGVVNNDLCKEMKCNMTKYYEWGAMLFGDETLASVPEPGQRIPETQVQWWDIDKFDNVETGGYSLTNEHGMEVMATKCRQYMQAIQLGLSGRHGPVSEQAVYEVMCMSFCTVNDQMRKDAMEYSCCSCMELSTQPDEVGFSRPGDWCREESGRMMCEELERCGTWECELDDYACPRMEYNTLTIDLKGKADIFGCAGVGGMFVALRQLGVGAAIVAAVAGMLAFN